MERTQEVAAQDLRVNDVILASKGTGEWVEQRAERVTKIWKAGGSTFYSTAQGTMAEVLPFVSFRVVRTTEV